MALKSYLNNSALITLKAIYQQRALYNDHIYYYSSIIQNKC